MSRLYNPGSAKPAPSTPVPDSRCASVRPRAHSGEDTRNTGGPAQGLSQVDACPLLSTQPVPVAPTFVGSYDLGVCADSGRDAGCAADGVWGPAPLPRRRPKVPLNGTEEPCSF